MDSNNKINVISYGGYYSTGGSVVRDIFREFIPQFEFATDFRLLKERYGLFDLEDQILNIYMPENIDLAIKDFIWLTTAFARCHGRLTRSGMSYDRYTNHVFTNATQKFIKELTDYTYPMSWHFYEFKKSYLSQVKTRVYKKIINKVINQNAIISYPTNEKYFTLAKDYINTILRGINTYNGREEGSIVGLHNAIPPFSIKQINKGGKYFHSCKAIIIDRDPRDVFINYPLDSYSRFLPETPDIIHKTKKFIHFFKSIRRNQKSVKNHPNVLLLKFEDMVNNYNEMLNQVLEFSELDKSEHKNRGKIFSPKLSEKNIGMWTKSTGKMAKAISLIEEELQEFLY